MPLPGGATDKFGNRYEGIWTARCMVDVLSACADSIRLEPPGIEGDGIEFWLKKGDLLEFHQVKRQNSPSGNWTIASLGSKDILRHFWVKLQNPNSSCVFVSTNSASQLEELIDRSNRAGSFAEFKREFLKAKSIDNNFKQLSIHWNNCTENETYSGLRRLAIETISERTLRSTVERELGSLIDGNPANAVDILTQFALDRVHHELKAEDIWRHLESRDFHCCQGKEPEMGTGGYGYPFPSYFIGREEILDQLDQAINQNSSVVVGGLAGIGKTYLVSWYVENLYTNKKVLWLDCNLYGQIEKTLVRLAEFLSYAFGDNTLLDLLRNPAGNLERRVEVAATVCDIYGCFLVWDNVDSNDHATLLPLFHECNRLFRAGKLIIITRSSIDFTTAISPVYKLTIPPLAQQFGIELMRHYLEKLNLEIYPDDILAQAHDKVAGHPYFLRILVILSEKYSLHDILKSLPQFQSQIHHYLQQQVFNQLTESTNNLIKDLSVLRTPFLLSAILEFENSLDASMSFEILLNKFLITRISKSSNYYEIHDLVREHARSLLTIDQKRDAHSHAASYYESLDPRTYTDLAEIVNHNLEAQLQERAYDAANRLVGNALHDGLFDLVIDVTARLFENEQTENWSMVHFARGRALRLKREFSSALVSYEKALKCADSGKLADNSKLEIASVLAMQHQHNSHGNRAKAKKLYRSLAASKNIETRVASLTSLGYLYIQDGEQQKGVTQLNQALKLAEKSHLKRNIRQICQALSVAYINTDIKKATHFLERADRLRQETSAEFGDQDIDADYFLFEAFTTVYNKQKRYENAVRVSEECVSIDRRLGLDERLALSLFHLGKNKCLAQRFNEAKGHLQESLCLIRHLELHGEPESSVLFWLATALWNSQDYPLAVEAVLENIHLNRHMEGVTSKHVVIREDDLKIDSSAVFGESTAYMLVLPRKYDYRHLHKWTQQVVKRRPELAVAKPLLILTL